MWHRLALMIALLPFPITELSAQSVLERILEATVTVVVEDGERTGSGFIVSEDGLIVTAAHVLDGASRASVILRSGEEFRVQGVMRIDLDRDLAIVRIAGFELPTVEFGSSQAISVGQRVLAIGAPLGLSSTVSDGLVSQFRVVEGTRLIQVSVPVSPGSSGGPIVTEDGLVVGIVVSGIRGGGVENVNFALPSNYVQGELRMAQGSTLTPLDALESPAVATGRTLGHRTAPLPRVNEDLRFDWSLLDGVAFLFTHDRDGHDKQNDHIAYSVSRTPEGDLRLLRTFRSVTFQTEDRWWSNRPYVEWWRFEYFSSIGFDLEGYESVQRFDPVSYTGPLDWRRQSIRMEGGQVEHERDGTITASFQANPGALPREFLGPILSVLDSVPSTLTLWVIDVERSTVQEARVAFDTTRSTRTVRVPREGSVCEPDTRTEQRTVEVIRRQITIRTDRVEEWVLADPPHLLVNEHVCMVSPASGLTGR